MLVVEDLKLNYRSLAILARTGLLPVNFNQRSGKLTPAKSEASKFVYKSRLVFMILTCLLKDIYLFKIVHNPQKYFFGIGILCINIFYLSSATVFTYGSYVIYRNLGAFSYLLSEVHRHKRSRGSLGKDYPAGVALSHEEKNLIRLPLFIFNIIPLSFLVLWFMPDRAPHLFYGQVLEFVQGGPIVYAICLALEMWLIVEITWPMYFFFYIALALTTTHIRDDMLSMIQKKICTKANCVTKNLRDSCKMLACVWLKVKLFNEVGADMNYLAKMKFFIVGIFGLTLGIHFCHIQPVVSFVCACLGLNNVLDFGVIYGSCYLLPRKVTEIKRKILQVSKTIPAKVPRLYFAKLVKATPACKIYAGQFYTWNRTSVPTFVDFALKQVVRLLVSIQSSK